MSFVIRASKLAMAGAATISLCVGVAHADAIADRQAVMKANLEAMKALGAMAKGEAEFDAAAVEMNGNKIAAGLEEVKTMFPDGSQTGGGDKPTRAKPEIWTDTDGFVKIADDGIAAAQAVAAVTEMEALAPALGNLGGMACKACHDKYRQPQE